MKDRITRIIDTLTVAIFSTFWAASILLMLVLFLSSGCRGITPDRCAQSAAIYEAYIDALERGEVIDADTIKQARLAGEILVISCGWVGVWQPEEAVTRSLSWKAMTRENGEPVTVPLDRYFVPIIERP